MVTVDAFSTSEHFPCDSHVAWVHVMLARFHLPFKVRSFLFISEFFTSRFFGFDDLHQILLFFRVVWSDVDKTTLSCVQKENAQALEA